MGWLFFDRILRMTLALLVGLWIARYLGPDKFGLFNYATAFVSLFGALVTLGLNDIVVRDVITDKKSEMEILGTTFWLKLFGGVAVSITSVSLVFLLRPGDTLMHWLVAILAFATVFDSWSVIDLWFQSQVQSKFTVWAKSIAYLITKLVEIGAILFHAPLIVFAIAVLFEAALGALGLVISYRSRGYSLDTWRSSFERAKILLSASWPLAVSTIMNLIYKRIDVVMLGQMSGDHAVGIYTASSRLLDYGSFVPLVLASSLFPSLVKSWQRDKALYANRLQHFYDLNAGLAYAIIAFAVPLAPFIISLLYGKDYAATEPIFVIYIWANLFVYLAIARGRQLVNEGLVRFLLIATGLGAVVNVGLNLILIPNYEGIGAATATVAAQFIAAYLSSAFLLPKHKIWIMQTKALFSPIRYSLKFINLFLMWKKRP